MTFKLAVFGNPIAHSLSPQIHEQFAAQAGIDVAYEKVLVESEQFKPVAQDFFAAGGKGLNITVPHKLLAYDLAQQRSEEANAAKAVNTLFKTKDGELRGENTDGWGLLKDIETNLKWQVKNQRVLLLGAGGAAQGVVANLLKKQPALLVIANRTYERAATLVERFNDPRFVACDIVELSDLEPFDLIISASSGGLDKDNQESFLPANLRQSATCCYDMIYGKQTPFLAWAETLPKTQRSDGLGMLVEQAARSFELWFDVKVETRQVLTNLRETRVS